MKSDHMDCLYANRLSARQLNDVVSSTRIVKRARSFRLTESTSPFVRGKGEGTSILGSSLGLMTGVLQSGHFLSEESSSTPQFTQ